jgi:hypothetical protein
MVLCVWSLSGGGGLANQLQPQPIEEICGRWFPLSQQEHDAQQLIAILRALELAQYCMLAILAPE